MTGFAWGLLFGAFFSVVLVIYWLTEKPKKHELPLPPIRKPRMVDVEPWGREVKLEPPAVIGTISESYDHFREPPAKVIELPYTPPTEDRVRITDFKPVGPPPSAEQIAQWEAEDEDK